MILALAPGALGAVAIRLDTPETTDAGHQFSIAVVFNSLEAGTPHYGLVDHTTVDFVGGEYTNPAGPYHFATDVGPFTGPYGFNIQWDGTQLVSFGFEFFFQATDGTTFRINPNRFIYSGAITDRIDRDMPFTVEPFSGIIVRHNPQTGGSNAGIVGQSVTTPGGGPWNDISFNFYDKATDQPSASGTLYLLGQEYLGTPEALPSAPGLIASTSTVAAEDGGSEWVFDPAVELQSTTTYWFYADSSTGWSRRVDGDGGYTQGAMYWTAFPTQSFILFEPFGNPADMEFELETIPQTGTITIVKDADPADGTDFGFAIPQAFVDKWGSPGSAPGEFDFLVYSNDVATDSSGNVYVADTGNNRIQKFDHSGNFLLEWGGLGSGNGQFEYPSGLAVDGSNNIYVLESGDWSGGGNCRIQKFDANGTYLTQWGSYGDADGQFWGPTGIATAPNGDVYVTDALHTRVQKFNSNGDFLLKWGTPGTAPGEFDWAWDVAVDSQGNVFVAEINGSHRIQKFTGDGTYVTHWGDFGSGDGQFQFARGVGVDCHDHVYVADALNHRVQRFDNNGVFIEQWGTAGDGDGQFSQPYGVDGDDSGNLFVLDLANDRIQKFRVGCTLDDAVPDDGDGVSSSLTLSNLTAGDHNLTEILPSSAWFLDNVACVGGNSTTIGNGVTVHLQAGENVTCTFTNASPTQPGACCHSNGSCTEGLAVDCISAGGVWQGVGTTCTPNPCPQPGACCLPDGNCQMVIDQMACDALNGVFQGPGIDCSSVTCPVLNGACCLPNGDCQLVADQVACDALNGVFQGHGVDCSSISCPVLDGACCLPSGNCQMVADQAACNALSGVFQGHAVDCSAVTCPALTGACCLPCGGCQEVDNQAACNALGGTFQGLGTDCATTTCPGDSSNWSQGTAYTLTGGTPNPFPAIAVHPNQTLYAVWINGSSGPIVLSSWNGSTWVTVSQLTPAMAGVGSFSDDLSLAIDLGGNIHLAFRASIGSGTTSLRGVWYGLYNGSSWSTEQVDAYTDPSGWKNTDDPDLALDANGRPHIAYTFSNANTPRTYQLKYAVRNGAWTISDLRTVQGSGARDISYPSLAVSAAGHAHVSFMQNDLGDNADDDLWYGTNASGAWGFTRLVTGTSVRPGEPSSLALDTNGRVHIAYNERAGEDVYVIENTTGSWVTTPIEVGPDECGGSIELSINTQNTKLLAYSYRAANDSMQGLKAAVQWNSDPWLIETAYCQTDTSVGICYYIAAGLSNNAEAMTLFDHIDSGWTTRTVRFSAKTLEPPGACCESGGSCSVASASHCAAIGGTWQGPGTSCSPNPCPQPGACCAADGSCTIALEADCASVGGTWQGPGTTCSPNPCPQPGACCAASGSCAVVFEADCLAAGGSYQGDGTSCNPNPCVATMIVEKQTDPDGAPDVFTFNGDAAGQITDDQQIVVPDLAPGTYTSSEVVPAGWDLTSITFDDANSTGDIGTGTATFRLEAGETVTGIFTNTQSAYALTVNVAGNGSVAKTPDQPTYAHGTTVELTATPDPGWAFVEWQGDLTGTTNPAQITMDGDKSVTAVFEQEQYTLTVNIEGPGTVAVVPDQATYLYGDVVTLTATADPGARFDRWKGDLTGTTNPETLTIDGNKMVTAAFSTPAELAGIHRIGTGSGRQLVDLNPTTGAGRSMGATFSIDSYASGVSTADRATSTFYLIGNSGGQPTLFVVDGTTGNLTSSAALWTNRPNTLISLSCIEFAADGKLYGLTNDTSGSGLKALVQIKLDGELVDAGPPFGIGGNQSGISTYDRSANTLYFSANAPGGSNRHLYGIDVATGSVLNYPQIQSPGAGFQTSPKAIEADPTSGLVYGVFDSGSGNTDFLVTIDPATGATATLGSGFEATSYSSGLHTFAEESHTLYWVSNAADGQPHIYAIDATAGDAVISPAISPEAGVGNVPGFIEYVKESIPDPTGACCFADGSCDEATDVNCTGAWQGAATTCSPNPCPQTLMINIDGQGTVTLDPDQATYAYGDVVTLTATADPGWTFSEWTGDLGGSTNPVQITMDGSKTVTAVFTQNQYTLTINITGNGSVTKAPDQATYVYGDVVTVTATPDQDWLFDQWTGDLAGSTNPEQITMDDDKTVTAVFAPEPGACCYLPLGDCQIQTEADCVAAGGKWQGPASTCLPNNPCPGLSWTTLSFPNAQWTRTWGIDNGVTVGVLKDAAGDIHGFKYDGQNWTQLDFQPGATETQAWGIDGNNIVGHYVDGSGDIHGFLYDGANWTQLDHPAAAQDLGTFASGIFGNEIVGYYLDGSRTTHGFIYNIASSGWESLDHPDAAGQDTLALGIDGNNLVGCYKHSAIPLKAFRYDRQVWDSMTYTGASRTRAWGIDGTGIVGTYEGVTPGGHGFLYDGVDFVTVDRPNSLLTRLRDIDRGQIVGWYSSTKSGGRGDDDGDTDGLLGEFRSACCTPDPPYCEILTQADCDYIGGTWTGPFVGCEVDDCNTNGIPDQCETGSGLADDCDLNWIPDECELCGDLDDDADVDYDDYVIFLEAFGGVVDGVPFEDYCCDYDATGAVGMADYATWLACYRDFVGNPLASPPTRPPAVDEFELSPTPDLERGRQAQRDDVAWDEG